MWRKCGGEKKNENDLMRIKKGTGRARNRMIGRGCEQERAGGVERRRENDEERGVKRKREFEREGER